jgi:hypothetical protein
MDAGLPYHPWREPLNIETIVTRENLETHTPRRAWSKPDLIDYGTVGDLTQGGATSLTIEDALYTST